MAAPVHLGGAAALGTAATTTTLAGLVTGRTLLVAVKAAGDSGSTLGNPSISDTLGSLTYDDTPDGLTSTIRKDANTTRQCLTAIYAATVGADVTGTVTATVADADEVRIDVYQLAAAATFLDTATDFGALNLTTTLSPAPELDDHVLACLAQHEYSIPSSVAVDGATVTSTGSIGDGTVTGSSTSLRWLDATRTDSTSDEVVFYYVSGGGWAHTASAVSWRAAATPDPPAADESGVGTKIEVAYGGTPFTEAGDLVWTDETANVDGAEPVTWIRGVDSPLSPPQPGSLGYTLKSFDRRFDPVNTDSPLYGALLPRVPTRITRYAADGTPSRRSFGFIRSWPQEDVGDNAATATPIEAVDAFSILQTITCPLSEYELHVLQDDPLIYYPLDDSVAGFTRDASPNDFSAELPSGLESWPVSEFGGDGGVVGSYAGIAVSTGSATHALAANRQIRVVEFIIDPGVNRFPAYTGSGTETYTERPIDLRSGDAHFVIDVRRQYAETGSAGRFVETTALQISWLDDAADVSATMAWVEIDRRIFSDPSTAEATFQKQRAAAAEKLARQAHIKVAKAKADYKAWAFWGWALTAADHPKQRVAQENARSFQRAMETAIRDANAAVEAAKAARVLATESAYALKLLDVMRDDTAIPVHVVARVVGGATLQVWVNGAVVASIAAGADATAVTDNELVVTLSPRGCALGHVAAYEADLDPQHILEHSVAARVGLGSQRTGERARLVLHAVGWPESFADVADGNSYISGPAGGSVFAYLSDLAEAEQCRLFVAGDGKVTFRDRKWNIQDAAATVAAATLQGHTGEPAARYAHIHRLPASAETIVNDAIVVREGGVPQRKAIPRAQRVAGTATRALSGLQLTNDETARNLAAYLIRLYADPQEQIDRLDIDVAFDPDYWMPIVASLDLGVRVTAQHHPQGVGTVFEQASSIEGLSEAFTGDGALHTVSLYLVPAQESATEHPWFTIGVSETGVDPIHF